MNERSLDQLDLIAAEGEGQKLEFKEAMSRLDREIVAFANASGGSIFLGIDDTGRVRGLEISNRLRSQIQDLAGNCDPPVRIALHTWPGKVLEIRVDEGADKPYRCKDGFFLRTGPNAQKLKRDEIVEVVVASGRFRFDETINHAFNYPQDFDQRKLEQFLKISGIEAKMTPEDVLVSLAVAQRDGKRTLVRQAGVLCFARAPQKFIRESYVTCVRYRGTNRLDVIDRKDIGGDLITQIQDVVAFVRKHMATRYVITGNTQRRELHEYPLVAIREAVTNAIMHRDYYYDASHIYLHMFADRLELENPGGLHRGLTLEDLGKRSVRRNGLIADILYRAKFVERIGSGIERMRSALKDNGNPAMEITATNFFSLRFYPRVDHKADLILTDRQNRLFQFIKQQGLVTKSTTATHLGVSGDTALRKLKVLINHHLVQRQGTGKAITYGLA